MMTIPVTLIAVYVIFAFIIGLVGGWLIGRSGR